MNETVGARFIALSKATMDNWQDANQRYLPAALAAIRLKLERHAVEEDQQAEVSSSAPESDGIEEEMEAMSVPPALQTLCRVFGLSAFEREILLLCAGVELDSSFAHLCAAAQAEPARTYPTFGLALVILSEPHWGALAPNAPLRRWRLIEIRTGNTLSTSPLAIDERILHYLMGVQHMDERLAGIIEPMRAAGDLVPTHSMLVERIVAAWSRSAGTPLLPIIQLCGTETAAKRNIAAAACDALGLNVSRIVAHVVPTSAGELDALIRLWEREAALGASALYLECDEVDTSEVGRERIIDRLIESVHGVVVVSSRERRHSMQRPMLAFDVRKPTTSEQRSTWQKALGSAAGNLNGKVEMLVSQFSLNAATITSASAEVLGQIEIADNAQASISSDELSRLLWDTCRVQARPRLDDLAQRIEVVSTWEDLVLPEVQCQTLHDIAAHVKQRATVYETWGFAAKGARGLGISALFAGVSGTGKTMAAEVLANELRLDLYCIDLSQIVSKYIGETEKNLRRVFDAAEEGGAILLFDEADALFGRRSEVKDSHDRYANLEVSYLLQRMETYRGLAILTTNLKDSLDPAFLRRLRFIVPFPFPDAAERTEIWRRVFPAATPTAGLDPEKLGRLNVAGGNIRNIALAAAFLAADAGEPVQMKHLLRAARSEYGKIEKPLTDAEVRGWV